MKEELAIIQKIFETNSSFQVKWRTTGKIQFQEFFASIEKKIFFRLRLGTRL